MIDSRTRPPTLAEIIAHEARPRSKGVWLWQREPGHPGESAVYRCTRCRLAIGASVVIVDGAPVAKLYAAPGGTLDGPEYVPCGGDDCCGPDIDA